MAVKGKMVVVTNRRGKKVRLMNPSQKAEKFAMELKNDIHLTNFGEVKTKRNGKPKRLSDTQKSFRSGYLSARKDNAKAYKSNQRKRVVSGYLTNYR